MTLLAAENLCFGYSRERRILDDVSLSVEAGDTIGLVGESGSGKTTLLRLLLGLQRPQSGSIRLNGSPLDPGNAAFMREFRRQVQVVYQDPYSSLDPRQTVFGIVSEPLRSLRIEGNHRQMSGDALEAVGLGRDVLERYPHQFSGGQRQRIAIARAIAPGPRLLLADEAVSALDLTTRVRIVELLRRLSTQMTLLFVSHDIGVVASLCKRIIILEKGRIVEAGETRSVLADPQHPYSQRLLASVPRLDIR